MKIKKPVRCRVCKDELVEEDREIYGNICHECNLNELDMQGKELDVFNAELDINIRKSKRLSKKLDKLNNELNKQFE